MEKATKKRIPVEATMILANLEGALLEQFSLLRESKLFPALQLFARKYVETKRNQILDLPTENERHLANEVAIRKGSIYAMGVLMEVIDGAQHELSRRTKE